MTTIHAPWINELLADAARHFAAARFAYAEKVCEEILTRAPRHTHALHLAGLSAHQAGNSSRAVEALSLAAELDPTNTDFASHLAAVLVTLRRYREASDRLRAVIALRPDFAPGHYNLGCTLRSAGDLAGAANAFRASLRLDWGLPEAHNALGNTLCDQQEYVSAVECYRRAIELRPDFVEAHNNLGTAYAALSQWRDAIAAYEVAIRLQPGFAGAHFNLGNALKDAGRLNDASLSYRNALKYQPDFVAALCALGSIELLQGQPIQAATRARTALAAASNSPDAHHLLGGALQEIGDFPAALQSYASALVKDPASEFKRDFARCVVAAGSTLMAPELWPTIAHSISEGWGRPRDLARAGTLAALSGTFLARLVQRVAGAEQVAGQPCLLDRVDVERLSGDSLLLALLEHAPVCELALEQMLTVARRELLASVVADASRGSDDVPRFYRALARQCDINEYVFSADNEEIKQVAELRSLIVGALQANQAIPALAIVALACYERLGNLPAAGRLLERPWPTHILKLLHQQVSEPLGESKLRGSIQELTSIDGAVSASVREQYEQNPYPRWTVSAPPGKTRSLAAFIRRDLSLPPHDDEDSCDQIDILIAGCGTGQEAIETARQFPTAAVTAIDLSVTSLAYGLRKATELNVKNLIFAQADILKLPAIGRQFDLVSSVGVLHHLEDPYVGLTQLATLVKPSGFMRLGLYSAHARRALNEVRTLVAAGGSGSDAASIRKIRKSLIQTEHTRRCVAGFSDFFSTSEFRDLVLHVQEHQLTLPQIQQMLTHLRLTFLGFSLEASVLNSYRSEYSSDTSATNLECWNDFEIRHPSTFRSMYQFWVQAAK